jgi:hypothetical protein
MTKLRAFLAGAVIAALAGTAYLYAQGGSQTLTGNEVVQFAIGGPGGSIVVVPVSQLRNATGQKLFSGAGAQTYTALTTDSLLYWVGTAPTTWTITTPVTPWDGQMIQIGTDTTLTTLVTLTANTGQSLDTTFTSQTVNAKTSVEFIYNLSQTKWYQMR